MKPVYSDFWLRGGVLDAAAWEAKDAVIPPDPPLPGEELSLDEWLKLPAAEQAALCMQWGGFTPPSCSRRRISAR